MDKLACAALAVVLCLVARAAAAQSFAAVTLADYTGAEIFLQFCASCHGESARGDGPVAASLANAVPNLTRIAARRDGVFPAAEIAQIVDGRSLVISAHGTREMPVWGYEFWIEEGADIEAEEDARNVISRLIDYLESIQAED